MNSRLAQLFAPFAAFSVAAAVAACCCPSRRCEPAPDVPACYSTTFQRLVVTNKHTKPVLVTATGWDLSHPTPVEVPLRNSPTLIAAAGGPGDVQSFPISTPGTNIDRIDVTYLADDDSDQHPHAESIPVISGVDTVTSCVRSYQPDTYQITPTCR